MPTGNLVPGAALLPRQAGRDVPNPNPLMPQPTPSLEVQPPRAPEPRIVDMTRQAGFGYRFGTMHPQGMIIHHTGGGTNVQQVINTYQRRNFPAQFVIDRDGTIYQTLPNGARGQHIKDGWGPYGSGLSNANMEGVEVIADDDKHVTPAQERAAASLVASRAQLWGYNPRTSVFGHGEVNPGHKEPDEGLTIADGIRNGALLSQVGAPNYPAPDANSPAGLAEAMAPQTLQRLQDPVVSPTETTAPQTTAQAPTPAPTPAAAPPAAAAPSPTPTPARTPEQHANVSDPTVSTPRGEATLPSTVPRGTMLTPQQIYQYALNAGFSGQSARTMTAIILQESGGGNPYAVNPRDPGGSYGLTQINAAAHGTAVAQATMGNPQEALNQAYRISNKGTNFRPWGSFTDGSYQQHMNQVANLAGSAQPVPVPAGPMQPAPTPAPAPAPAPPPLTYVAAPPGSGMATGLPPSGPVPAGAPPVQPSYVPAPAGTGMASGLAPATSGPPTPADPSWEPQGTVSYQPDPRSPLTTGGGVPRAVSQQQTQDTGAGGPASLPYPGTQGQPDTGPTSDVGGPGGNSSTWKPPQLTPGLLAGVGVPQSYNPSAIEKIGVVRNPQVPANALSQSHLGLAPPGREFAPAIDTPRVPSMRMVQSPFFSLIAPRGGGGAVGQEIGAEVASSPGQ